MIGDMVVGALFVGKWFILGSRGGGKMGEEFRLVDLQHFLCKILSLENWITIVNL